MASKVASSSGGQKSRDETGHRGNPEESQADYEYTGRTRNKGRADKPYALKKHPARKPSQRRNDVYINRTSDFPKQMARCRKLFEEGFKEIFIHGLGAAINRAINLALQLKETSVIPMELNVTTSTVEVLDEYEPLNEEYNHQMQCRPTSAIHIKLYQVPSVTKIVYSQQQTQKHSQVKVKT